jgi:hypothetical protein
MAAALRLAAFGLERVKCRLGEFCRRMKGRLGKAEGITATAHKLARVIYVMIANSRAYDEAEAFHKNPGVEQKQLQLIRTQSKKLRFQLVPIQQVTTS